MQPNRSLKDSWLTVSPHPVGAGTQQAAKTTDSYHTDRLTKQLGESVATEMRSEIYGSFEAGADAV